MEITNIEVSGMEAALRGMRNPLNSWAKSTPEADVELGRKLASAGATHGKFLRMITITCDITAPLYWWKEFDTYKVGTVANSCSTMHTLMSKPFEISDFELDNTYPACGKFISDVIDTLNDLRNDYIDMRQRGYKQAEEAYWRTVITMLPSGYLQRRTVLLNYEVMRRIVIDRTGHKLQEWKIFIDSMKEELPYWDEFILGKTGEECMKESVKKSFISVKECLEDNAEKFNSKYACENRVNGLQAALNHIDEVVKSFNNFNNSILGKTGEECLEEELKKKTLNEIRTGFRLPPVKGDIQKEFISNDPINPAHYKDHCSIECIEAMEIAFGEWETGYFCLGNAFKYLWRHKYKNGQEDLKKAIWYLDKAEELGGDEEKIDALRKTVEKYNNEEIRTVFYSKK